MPLQRLLIVLLCLLSLTSETAVQAQASTSEHEKIGLVLAGGGARGIAHIGVIRFLEEQGIKIDAVAGTSMGSIIAALYASGMNADQIEDVALNLDWAKAFDDETPRDLLTYREKELDFDFLVNAKLRYANGSFNLPTGLVDGQNLNFILHDIVKHVSHIRDFDDLPIPFRAVAADIATGEPVVIGSGDLAVAMRASMSLPGIYSPVDLDGRLLVDGGIANNLPVDVVKSMGVDRVIVVDISTPLESRENITDVLSIIGQLTSILTRKNTEYQLSLMEENDLLIVPPLDDAGITSASFELADMAIKLGYEATARKQTPLVAFRPASGERHQAMPAQLDRAEPVIAAIEIRNDSEVPDTLIRNMLRQREGQRLNRQALERDLSAVWGLDQFSRVDYFLTEPDDDNSTLVINARANERGTSYLKLGARWDQDSNGESDFGIRASWRQQGLNRLGGEWFTFTQLGGDSFFGTEFYQPLDEAGRFFVSGLYKYDQTKLNIAEDGDVFARTELRAHRAALTAGINLGNVAQLEAGPFFESARNKILIADSSFSSSQFDSTGYAVAFNVDTLDATSFPTSGTRAGIRYDQSVNNWGADTDFDAFSLLGVHAESWGATTLLTTAAWREVNVNDQDGAAPSRAVSIGGFLNLSGYTSNSLSGNYLGLGSLVVYHRLDKQGIFPVGMPTYIGGSIEAGNVWLEKSDADLDDLIYAGSVFVGFQTPLGPLYLGAGLAENNQAALYLQLGQVLD